MPAKTKSQGKLVNAISYKTDPLLAPNMREVKRIQLRDRVQREAFALFARHGYGAVTMAQIARAAKISRSTLFRHFVTKEAIVLYDSLDQPLTETFRKQPASFTTVQALRHTLQEVFQSLGANDKEKGMREELIRTVPAIRVAVLDGLAASIDTLAMLISERAHKTKDDILVRTLASALTGVAIGVLFNEVAQADRATQFEESLSRLEESLHI